MSQATSRTTPDPLELAVLGAEQAAASMAALLDRELAPRSPVASAGGAASKAATAVVFEMEGDLSGVVALLMSAPAREEVIEALGADTTAVVGQSALREFGNIVASQAVSAIADRLGSRITLSVPKLVDGNAGRELARRLAGRRSAAVVETALCSSEGDPEAVLLFAPDAPS